MAYPDYDGTDYLGLQLVKVQDTGEMRLSERKHVWITQEPDEDDPHPTKVVKNWGLTQDARAVVIHAAILSQKLAFAALRHGPLQHEIDSLRQNRCAEHIITIWDVMQLLHAQRPSRIAANETFRARSWQMQQSNVTTSLQIEVYHLVSMVTCLASAAPSIA